MRTPILLSSILLAGALLLGPSGCKPRIQGGNEAQPASEQTSGLMSVVSAGDPAASRQLIKGFHGIEQNAWRWTMQRFSVALRPPMNASEKGAVLVLRFALPESSLKSLKSVTVAASVDGTALSPESYGKAGANVYSREVPAQLLNKDSVAVDFALDKAIPPGSADQRELGIVVNTVGFEAK